MYFSSKTAFYSHTHRDLLELDVVKMEKQFYQSQILKHINMNPKTQNTNTSRKHYCKWTYMQNVQKKTYIPKCLEK